VLKSKVNANFLQRFGRLDPRMKEIVRRAKASFEQNPASVSFSKVTDFKNLYSARAGGGKIAIRVLGTRVGDSIVWDWVGSNHAEYEAELARRKRSGIYEAVALAYEIAYVETLGVS
jgi:hypothetical protein